MVLMEVGMLLTQLPRNLKPNQWHHNSNSSKWCNSRFSNSSSSSQCNNSLYPRPPLPVFLMTCLACQPQLQCNQMPKPHPSKEVSNLIRPASNLKWWTTWLEIHQIPLVRCSRVVILEPPKEAHPTRWMPWAAVSKWQDSQWVVSKWQDSQWVVSKWQDSQWAVSKWQANQWAHKWRDLQDSIKIQTLWPCNSNSNRWWWCSRGCSRWACRADSRTRCRFNRCSSRCKWWWVRCSRWWCKVNNLAPKAWASRCRHKVVWAWQFTECNSLSLIKCRTCKICNKCLCSNQRPRTA